MDLQAIIEDLIKQVETLKARVTFLEQENTLLRQENAQLRCENENLKERLGLNSQNSSLPPSRDLYRAKKNTRPPSGKKPGGQPGHKFHGYRSQTPDKVVDVFPERCSCGHSLEIAPTFRAEQKIEIPPIKPHVTEYRLYHGICRVCGKKKTASLPEGVSPDLLGNHAKAIISALSGFFHNSKRDIQQILKDIFHLPISLGLVSNTEKRVSRNLKSSYEELVDQAKGSAYLHIDETGHKCQGKRGWGWILTSRDVSVLKLASSRGKKVLQSLLPSYEGKIISDRYGAYRYFDSNKRQICWSHLKRDFYRFAHSQNPELAQAGANLDQIRRDVFALYGAFKSKKIDALLLKRRIRKIRKRMVYELKGILKVPNVPHAHRVAQNLLNSFGMMWQFVDDSDIEPTNNLAERQIRRYVVYRKKSLFTWSQRGNEFIERIFSLFLTCRLQNQNPFLKLSQLIDTPP
jgi:transposase